VKIDKIKKEYLKLERFEPNKPITSIKPFSDLEKKESENNNYQMNIQNQAIN